MTGDIEKDDNKENKINVSFFLILFGISFKIKNRLSKFSNVFILFNGVKFKIQYVFVTHPIGIIYIFNYY